MSRAFVKEQDADAALEVFDELEWRVQQRIGSVIHAYEEEGFQRTRTDVDRISGDWPANEVRQIGPEPTLEEFPLSRGRSCWRISRGE